MTVNLPDLPVLITIVIVILFLIIFFLLFIPLFLLDLCSSVHHCTSLDTGFFILSSLWHMVDKILIYSLNNTSHLFFYSDKYNINFPFLFVYYLDQLI